MTYPKTRLFVEHALEKNLRVPLPEKQAHYLIHVMRCVSGETVAVFNGRDGEWLASLQREGKHNVSLKIESQTRPQQSTPDIWLVFAAIKSGPMEYLAQKATELGVTRLLPVKTEHTAVGRANEERLYANAVEAAEQTGRLDVPEVARYRPLSHILGDWPQDRLLIYCDETGQAEHPAIVLNGLKEAPHPSLSPQERGEGDDRSCRLLGVVPFPRSLSAEALAQADYGEKVSMRGDEKLAMLIGPEGGFSERELEHLRSLPFAHAMHLGPRVLRADTAAVAGLTCLQLFLGDWETPPAFRAKG